MGFEKVKELPNLLKPVTLVLLILQTWFMFMPHYQGFGWFVILTNILMLIIALLVFTIFFLDVSGVADAPMWPLAEMIYAAVFAVCSGINTFYFIVNIFKHFNFFYILATGTSALLTLIWAFDAFLYLRARTSSSSNAQSYGSNQATATPAPATGFPYPAGHTTGSNPA